MSGEEENYKKIASAMEDIIWVCEDQTLDKESQDIICKALHYVDIARTHFDKRRNK